MTQETISYRTLVREDIDACSALAARVFTTREIVITSQNISYQDFYDFTRIFLEARYNQNLSVVAHVGDRIVGCTCVERLGSPAVAWSESVLRGLKATFDFLDKVEAALPAHVTTSPSVAHVLLIASDLSGRGVAAGLLEHTHALSKTAGLTMSVAEVTGPISQHAFAKQGYERLRSFPYTDFRAGDGVIADHGHCELVLKQL